MKLRRVSTKPVDPQTPEEVLFREINVKKTFGREPTTCDVLLQAMEASVNKGISRKHAVVWLDEDGVSLKLEHSALNGVILERENIQSRIVKDVPTRCVENDIIQFSYSKTADNGCFKYLVLRDKSFQPNKNNNASKQKPPSAIPIPFSPTRKVEKTGKETKATNATSSSAINLTLSPASGGVVKSPATKNINKGDGEKDLMANILPLEKKFDLETENAELKRELAMERKKSKDVEAQMKEKLRQDSVRIQRAEGEVKKLRGFIEDNVSCPICMVLKENIIMLHCGHSICADCWTDWKKTKPSCPTCSATVSKDFKGIVPVVSKNLVNLLKNEEEEEEESEILVGVESDDLDDDDDSDDVVHLSQKSVIVVD